MQDCPSLGVEGWEAFDTGHRAPCSELGWKALFSIFLCLFNKSILIRKHAENAGKSAEIDVLDLLKLQSNLLPPVGVKLRKSVYLI